MNFRKLVALIGVTVIAVALVVVGIAVVTITQTDFGREQLRNIIITRVASSMKGTFYLGRMRGGLFGGVTIDSVEIRDQDDSLFVASGPIHLRYDPRDLLDGRLIFSTVSVDRPVLHMRQHQNGEWNYRRIFPKRKKVPAPRGSRFGDWFVIDSAMVRDAKFQLTMPWEPDDSLKGSRRDSAIRHNLTRTDRHVRRVAGGFARTWHWTQAFVALSQARLAHPDTIGRAFDIAKLDVNESDPPFRFRNLEGAVRWAGDTIWLRAPHFDLPGSTGRAAGKVIWGSDLPVRYDIVVRGDSVSLADIGWVYPTLPREGTGSMLLRIRNDRANLRVIDYAISDMDVRAERSRLRGRMTFAVGGPVLVVKDVALEAAPVDLRLLKTLNGKPFPYDWAGTLTGTVRGRGGPLNRFVVDDARLVFRDAHVRGAVTRASGRGELDILFPAFTVFRGFDVDVASMDLRTMQFVNPDFPRLRGTVSGRATLDSSWLDVRFRNASLTHHDSAAPPSHVTGSGRVTFEDEFLRYDLNMNAEPVSFTTLALSYPAVPLRGSYSGPIRVRGRLDDLDVQTSLTGAGGTLSANARMDLFPSGYAVRGSAALGNVDLGVLLARERLPRSDITARIVADLTGDSLANLAGTLQLAVDRSSVSDVRVYDSHARLAFSDGRMRIDTMALETSVAMITGFGGLGLIEGRTDSIRYVVHMDSLGGLRRYIRPRAGRLGSAVNDLMSDSLAGAARLDGWLRGNLAQLDASGRLDGRAFFVAGDRIEQVTGQFDLADVLDNVRGSGSVAMSGVTVAGIRLDSAQLVTDIRSPTDAGVRLTLASANGPHAVMGAQFHQVADTSLLIVNRVAIDVGDHSWALAAPAAVRFTGSSLTAEPIRLADPKGGWVEISGSMPTRDQVSLRIRADSLALDDMGELAQLQSPLGGRLGLDWRIEGPRMDPRMSISATVRELSYGGANIEKLELTGGYADQRLHDTVKVYRGGASVLTAVASVPLDLSLVPVSRRVLDDSLSGWIRADSVDLAVLEAFTPQLRNAQGIFITDVRLSGTLRRPRAFGRIAVLNGSATVPNVGLTLQRIAAQISLVGDGARIERVVLQSGEQRGDTATLAGFIGFADLDDPTFALNFTARNFQAINRRSLAELQVSTAGRSAVTLDGRWTRARLRGTLIVDRGAIYIPEVFQKQLTDLSDPELAAMVDTTGFATRILLPDAPSELVENLELAGVNIVVGEDVWIRSPETNIKLSGQVDVTRTRDPRDSSESRLALVGNLNADRGTYTLRLAFVQRTFQVETGAIRFFGEAELNPTLDIYAIHTVRQANRQDIRIRVHLGGTLQQPIIELSSADGYRIDQSQLLSYLVTGTPTFEAGAQESATDKAISVALRSAGGLLSSELSGVLGLDVVQFSTIGFERGLWGGGGLGAVGRGVGSTLLQTRVDLGWQLSDRVYLSANTGLCNFAEVQGTQAYLESVGLRVDYRLPQEVVISAGTEPGNISLICNRQGQLRGFVQTPRQFGFDLSKTWRF